MAPLAYWRGVERGNAVDIPPYIKIRSMNKKDEFANSWFASVVRVAKFKH